MKEGGGNLVLWPATAGLHSGLGATAVGDWTPGHMRIAEGCTLAPCWHSHASAHSVLFSPTLKAPWTVFMKLPQLCLSVLPPRSKSMSPSSRLPKGFAVLEKESKAGVSWPVSTLSRPQSFHSQKGEGSGKAPLWVPELRPEGASHNLGRARLAQICRKGGSSD